MNVNRKSKRKSGGERRRKREDLLILLEVVIANLSFKTRTATLRFHFRLILIHRSPALVSLSTFDTVYHPYIN